jgi:secreted trypsin-like serine protease
MVMERAWFSAVSAPRRLVVFLALVASLVLASAPAGAVTNGEPDGTAHSYVGLAVFYDAAGTPQWRCSGTLLSPTVFLTAGHCTEGAASAQVWFAEHVTRELGYPFTGGIKGTPYTHPNYVWSFPNTSDVGVIVLNKGVRRATYGVLPQLGALDALATKRGTQDVTFTVVGYGLQEVKPRLMAERSRLQATVQLVNLRNALTDGYNIHHTAAPGTGGGTCFGDSGGPVFRGTSNIVVGITSFGLNSNCAGSGFAYRTDIANTQNFIAQFL